MQVLSNSGKLAMVLGTRTILLHSNHRFPPSLTHFNSFPLPSLQSQPNTTASSGRHRAAIATADVCDSNAELLANGDLRALDPLFKMYGQCLAFSGSIVTVKVFEDNVLVRQLLESKGNGRVLVIDGGGSTRCALVGGNLAQTARDMGWAGIVVNGCIRDVNEINGCDIGVRALGSNPLKSNKKAVGEKHVPVRIAGTLIHDEEWLYADSDGILISKIKLSV
ncbi:putative 4-hydroxy-4-methyl-2-oxoglutarate aldolase 3 isoform X2 [Hibiscus syriacus]|uniref:putative 4-hydroxy-4-methyl-2-oxoglutarate aldolase 3 isoform X2 n=1 Tax=Hibiscus syriacus TaxID=106335 RepID=UPI001924F204|nr:putative 4-hydroxy-4-methyl-2-oxoglutarate aldolase 3 isoform X2 [Hibiscus syriacus]